jgi:hypothetical protein
MKSAALIAALAALVAATLAQQWDFEVVDSGSLGNYVAIDRMSDGTLWLAYVSADSHVRLAHKDSLWVYEDVDTSVVRPNFQSWPPFSFDIGPGDVVGVVGLGRLAERRDSGWSSEELPMPMRDCAFSFDLACRPSLTFKDSLWQGCLGLRTESGWDTNVVFRPSEYTMWYWLSRPSWRRNENCAFMEDDVWQMPGIDGYGVGLYTRDSGIWTASAFVLGLDGGGSGFAALVDSADSVHTFWSASDPYGTNELVCDGVWLDSCTGIAAACLDTARRVQCAWIRDHRLRFTVLGRPTMDVGDADGIAFCGIVTDTTSQPVIAYWRDGSIVVAHGMDIVGQAEERQKPTANSLQPTASVIRNVLFLPEAPSYKLQAASLLDAGGRRVMDLAPGANDISRLAPGVYFVITPHPVPLPQGEREESTDRVRKVVVAR